MVHSVGLPPSRSRNLPDWLWAGSVDIYGIVVETALDFSNSTRYPPSAASRPFLYNGEMPPHDISPVARVVRVRNNAWPVARIRNEGGISEAGINITWEAGQASALHTDVISEGRDVGTIRVRDTPPRP